MTSSAYRKNFKLIDWSGFKPLPSSSSDQNRRAFHIIKDIEPYQNVIDGGVVGGRRQHREFLKAHGVEEVGNEKPKPPRRPQIDRKEIARDTAQALEMVKNGYRPRPLETYREES